MKFNFLSPVIMPVAVVLTLMASTLAVSPCRAQSTPDGAQINHRDILKSYSAGLSGELIPQQEWKPFPRTPAEWKQQFPDSILLRIVAAAETANHFEFRSIPATLILEYVRTGNRVHYEKASFEKRNALWDLMLAESVEGRGRFTDQVLNGIWSICEETYWGLPAHLGAQKAGSGLPDVEDPTVDLFTAETAAVMAWTDYFDGAALEKISKLVRPRIYYEVNRRVFLPLLTAKYGYLGGGRDDAKLNNWAPWVMSNYCAAALLLEKDVAKRAEAVQLAMHYTDQYINGLGDDGGCDEGPGYWTAAGGCVFDVLNLLGDASGGKINVYGKPIIQKMGAYIYKTHISGKYYINVADAHPQLIPDGLMLFRFGQAVHDPVMTGFGSWIVHQYPEGAGSYEQFHRTRRLYDLREMGEAMTFPPREPAVKESWFADVQLMASRTADGFFVAAHAGHNGESHNHNDVGDFIVYAGGQPVIIDVGSGTYTERTFSRHRYDLWFNTSAYHNLPLINGMQQPAGAEYTASRVQYLNNPKFTLLAMDLAKAYPGTTGIRSWLRTVRVDAASGITISDRFEANEPLKSLEQSFMTVCTVDLGKPGTIGFETAAHQKVWLDYDAGLWDAGMEKIEWTIPEDEGIKQNWEGRPIYRVLLKAKKLASSGSMAYAIHK